MSDLVVLDDGRSAEWVLFFDNRKPISAADLSKLLSDLSKDYRRYSSGQELILIDLQAGSLRLKFIAAAAVGMVAMTQINTIYDFGKNVSEVISAAKAGHSQMYKGRRQPAVRSAQSILDAAIKSESTLTLHYKSIDGEELTLEIEAPEAQQIKDQAQEGVAAEERTQIPHEVRKRIGHANTERLNATIEEYAQRRLTAPTIEAREDADRSFAMAIHLLVSALQQSGSSYVVEEIAQKLESRGLPDVAKMIRDARDSEGEPDLVSLNN